MQSILLVMVLIIIGRCGYRRSTGIPIWQPWVSGYTERERERGTYFYIHFCVSLAIVMEVTAVTVVTHGVEDGVAVVAGGGDLHHVATVGVAQGPPQDSEAHHVAELTM